MNVKQGDLAFIVGSCIAENNMAIVEVIEFVGVRVVLGQLIPNIWRVETKGRPLLGIFGELIQVGCICDQLLRPISGLPDMVDTLEEVTA